MDHFSLYTRSLFTFAFSGTLTPQQMRSEVWKIRQVVNEKSRLEMDGDYICDGK